MEKARDAAFESGNDVFFPGVVLGDALYATPQDGWLVLSGGQLWWSAAEGYGKALWQALSLGGMRALNERPVRRDFESELPVAWMALDCSDGQSQVTIACAKHDIKFARAGLTS
jgi:hypothetical protein